jgi:hypothetical protein
MPRFKPKGVLDQSAMSDLWRHTLAQIPTVYGRLAYLSSLRDVNSGIYRHHGLSAMFGRDESNLALRHSHEKAFEEWLKLPLREQHKDLGEYLASLDEPRPVIVEQWLKARNYKMLVPESARAAERLLFSRDLEALLEAIRNDGAAKGPGSSPRS